MRDRSPEDPKFAWQTGYGAFSVSESQIGHVRRYIRKQEEHHRRRTFQEELRDILSKHHIEFDERYLLALKRIR